MKDRIEIYTDAEGKKRWRWVAAENGEVLADSGQGYVHLEDCLRPLARISGEGMLTALRSNHSFAAGANKPALEVVFL